MDKEEVMVNGKKESFATNIDDDLIETNDIYDKDGNLITDDKDLEDTLVFQDEN